MTLRTRLSLSVALVAALVTAPVFAAAWTVDVAHSSVDFSVRHFVSNVTGGFNQFEGAIQFDAAKPEMSSVTFTIQAKSIDTANENRDNHLRSPDFFDVEKFPTLSFKSTAVKAEGKDKLMVTGDFTMHGVTKQVTVPVMVLGAMETPQGGKAGFSAEFTVNRKDYGIVWNRALDAGGAILGDDVKVTINIEANGEKPAAAPAK